jgi:hypothetical protein
MRTPTRTPPRLLTGRHRALLVAALLVGQACGDAGGTGGAGGSVTPVDAGRGGTTPPDATGTGGQNTGGTPVGGQNNGGTPVGGENTGGTPTGGTPTGGTPDAAPVGGANTGGTPDAALPTGGMNAGGVIVPPDDPAVTCAAGCAALAACQGAVDVPDLKDACEQACRADSTPAQRACVTAAGADCDALAACFAGDAPPPPDPVVEGECNRACAASLACAAPAGLPPEPELAADCETACQRDSTPAQRACATAAGADCDALAACFEAEVPPPDEALVATCEAACAGALACGAADAPPEIEAGCVAACVATSTPEQLDCMTSAGGDCDAQAACFAGGAPPEDPALRAACEAGCDAAFRCAAAVDAPAEVRSSCVDGCVSTSTPAERDCVAAAAGNCDALASCFAGDPPPPPDPALQDECTRACAAASACAGPDAPPDLDAACVEGCVATSTPAQRACVLAAPQDCAALGACLSGEMQ